MAYDYMMKHALCLIAVLATPAMAETPAAPPAGVQEGVGLMQQGAEMLLRGLMANMEPALKDMGEAVAEMEPKLRELMAIVDDITNYHPPELLENGDILIRRKTPAELKLETLPGNQIDL